MRVSVLDPTAPEDLRSPRLPLRYRPPSQDCAPAGMTQRGPPRHEFGRTIGSIYCVGARRDQMPALTTMGPLFLTSIPHPGPDRATGMICLTSSPSVQPSALA